MSEKNLIEMHPKQQMKVTMMLADYAVGTPDGKLTVVGAGWSIRAPVPAPFAVAAIVEVPWDQANKQHTLQLTLTDADGQPFNLPDGSQFALPADNFEVGRPPGVKPGTALAHNVVLNCGPLPFEAGKQYVWQLTINGTAHEDWRLPFSVAPGDQLNVA
jgi:hypothetical protein